MKHRKTATLAGAALTAPALAFSLAPPAHAEAAPTLTDETTQSIPKITPETEPPAACAEDYIVRRGDTLSQIAKVHGADLDAVKELNPGIIAGARPDDYSAVYSGGHVHLPAGHCHPTSSKVPEVFYKGCSTAPEGLKKGDPGYRHFLDMDGDGKACEGPWPPVSLKKAAAKAKTTTVTGTQESAAADAAIAYAKSKLGSPYVFGATGPSSFDCSGLVYAAYTKGAGLPSSFPRDTLDELHGLPHVSDGSTLPANILPGDLILMYFTGTSQPGYAVNHVTMYLGDGKQIEATGSHGGVAITNVEGRGGRIVAVVRPTPAKKVTETVAVKSAPATSTSPAIAPDCPGTASGYCQHDPSFWAPVIEQAMTLVGGNVAANHDVAGVERLMTSESSGNPNAINNYDSNAQNGDPSRGLMQTIGATFNAYHVAGTSTNIYDPLANIAAALAYINDQYGGNIPSSPY